MTTTNNINVLIKKLNYVGTIKTRKYNLGWPIFDLVVEDKCDVVAIDPFDNFYLFRKLNIKDKNEWITYDDCRDIEFFYHNDGQKEYVGVEVKTYTLGRGCWEGGRVLKWKAKFLLPIEFVDNIQTEIDRAFDNFAEISYEHFLENNRLKWIEEFKKEMLK